MNIFKKTLTHTAFTIGGFMLLTSNSHAALLDLSNVPLFLQGGVDPNILIVIDDSGSMGWEVLLTPEADAISNSANSGDIDFTPNDNNSSRRRDEWRRLCSGYNVLAYDPLKTYTPWSGIDNNNSAYVDMTNLSLTLDDPYDGFISGNYDDIDQL